MGKLRPWMLVWEFVLGILKCFSKLKKKFQNMLNSLELPSKFTLALLGGQCVMNSRVVMRD